MPIPDLTHLQFFILSAMLDGEQSGRIIRQKLAEHGDRRSGPAFYQLMSRMEDSRLVKGRYRQKIVEGQIIKERWYKITAAGITALERVQDFYAARLKGGAHA